MKNCPTCDGRAKVIAYGRDRELTMTCPICDGAGQIPTEEEIEHALEYKRRQAQNQESQVAQSQAPVDARGKQSVEANRRRSESNQGSERSIEEAQENFVVRFVFRSEVWQFMTLQGTERYIGVQFSNFPEAANRFILSHIDHSGIPHTHPWDVNRAT